MENTQEEIYSKIFADTVQNTAQHNLQVDLANVTLENPNVVDAYKSNSTGTDTGKGTGSFGCYIGYNIDSNKESDLKFNPDKSYTLNQDNCNNSQSTIKKEEAPDTQSDHAFQMETIQKLNNDKTSKSDKAASSKEEKLLDKTVSNLTGIANDTSSIDIDTALKNEIEKLELHENAANIAKENIDKLMKLKISKSNGK